MTDSAVDKNDPSRDAMLPFEKDLFRPCLIDTSKLFGTFNNLEDYVGRQMALEKKQ